MATHPVLMSQRAYAAYRKMTRKAIANKVKTGHILLDANGLIDMKAADQRDKQMLHPRKGNRSPNTPNPDTEVTGKSYTEILKIKELFKGRRERLAYRREVGELVLKSAVEKDAFETARIIRDVLLNIPTRVSGEIAGELGLPQGQGQEKVFAILTKEIEQALEGLTS